MGVFPLNEWSTEGATACESGEDDDLGPTADTCDARGGREAVFRRSSALRARRRASGDSGCTKSACLLLARLPRSRLREIETDRGDLFKLYCSAAPELTRIYKRLSGVPAVRSLVPAAPVSASAAAARRLAHHCRCQQRGSEPGAGRQRFRVAIFDTPGACTPTRALPAWRLPLCVNVQKITLRHFLYTKVPIPTSA